MINEKRARKKLQPIPAAMFDLLKSGRNVSIERLAKCLSAYDPNWTSRETQQRVGAHIVHINRAIGPYDHRVVPGNPRGSYQLKPLD